LKPRNSSRARATGAARGEGDPSGRVTANSPGQRPRTPAVQDPGVRDCGSGLYGHLEADRTYWWVVLGIFVAATIFRLVFLRADPPWQFTWSQDLFTDGARVVDGARNKILFGSWITDPRSPGAIFYPLPTLIAWAVFKALGIGLAQANLTGVLPGLGALVVAFFLGKKIEGRTGGLLMLLMLGFSYLHMIYSRVPMVEALLVLTVLAAFWLAMGGRRHLFVAGLVVGSVSLMVKLHAIHFVPVVLLYVVLVPAEDLGRRRRWHLAASFAAGLALAGAIWVAAIYAQHAAILDKYFTSNVVLAQKEDYQGITALRMIERRLAGIMHGAAGRDGFFAKTPDISILGLVGLLGILSRYRPRKPSIKSWELFAALWFLCLLGAFSLLSYRPLRYLALMTPSVILLATSLLLRLARGEPVFAADRPRWFVPVFGVWLAWMVLHLQQEIVFQIMTGGRVVLVNEMNAFQKSLYKYQFMVFPQLLVFGGLCLALILFFHRRIAGARLQISPRAGARIFAAALVVVVAVGTLRFTLYAADRKYSILESARSLSRVLSEGVLLAGDCSAVISLETDFKTLPSYGDLIRYKEKDLMERYPVTHFILRFPTLFEYLSANYPDFEEEAEPLRIFGLCGREATVVSYNQWPGYRRSSYRPSGYELAVSRLHADDISMAAELFQSFLSKHPDSYEALWGLTLCAFRDGREQDAKALIERALELTDRDALCFEAYADILDTLGERTRAIGYYKKALSISPNSKRLARKLATARGLTID
jgi:4-amino-4-deoxy-L-arabinose transferase-like glycosyltransferase